MDWERESLWRSVCTHRNIGLHDISGFIPELRYTEGDKTGALGKSGYSD